MTDTRYEGTTLDRPSMSGLTESEAREFHRYFTSSFLGFLFVAIIAHILMYVFSPWGVGM